MTSTINASVQLIKQDRKRCKEIGPQPSDEVGSWRSFFNIQRTILGSKWYVLNNKLPNDDIEGDDLHDQVNPNRFGGENSD